MDIPCRTTPTPPRGTAHAVVDPSGGSATQVARRADNVRTRNMNKGHARKMRISACELGPTIITRDGQPMPGCQHQQRHDKVAVTNVRTESQRQEPMLWQPLAAEELPPRVIARTNAGACRLWPTSWLPLRAAVAPPCGELRPCPKACASMSFRVARAIDSRIVAIARW